MTKTALLFTLLVFTVGVLLLTAMVWVAPSAGGRDRGMAVLIALALSVVWIDVPGMLAWWGRLDRYTPLPAPALLVIAALTVFTVAFAFSPIGARLASGLPLTALVGYQVFRVPVELLLHRLYVEGAIPVQMTYAGRNFDIVSGATAVLVALLLRKGRKAPGFVLAWNVLGLALLANIVTIAVLSTPVPFRVFTEGPANTLPSTFPYVWLPSFLVQMALLGHLLVFRRLASERRAA